MLRTVCLTVVALGLAACAAARETSVVLFLRDGEELVQKKRYESAVSAFQEARRLDPTSVPAAVGLARANVALGRTSAAIAELNEILRLLEERESRGQLANRVDRAEVHFLLARILGGSGSPEKAVVHYGQSVSLAPARSDFHIALLTAYVEQNRLGEARKSLAQYPGFVAPILLLGLAHLQAGDPERAASDFATLRGYVGDLAGLRALEALSLIGGTRLLRDGKAPSDEASRRANDLVLASATPAVDLTTLFVQARLKEIEGAADAGARYSAARETALQLDTQLLARGRRPRPRRHHRAAHVARLRVTQADRSRPRAHASRRDPRRRGACHPDR